MFHARSRTLTPRRFGIVSSLRFRSGTGGLRFGSETGKAHTAIGGLVILEARKMKGERAGLHGRAGIAEMHLKHRARRVGRLEIARQKRRPDTRADRHRGVGLIFQINHRVVAEIFDVPRLFHALQFQVGSWTAVRSEIVAVGPRAIRIDLRTEITCQRPVSIRADDRRRMPKNVPMPGYLGSASTRPLVRKAKRITSPFCTSTLGRSKRDGLFGSRRRINRLASQLGRRATRRRYRGHYGG